MIAQPNAAARTACHVCFPDAFDQRGPCLTSGVPAPARAPRGRYLAERGPGGFPVIAVLPSMFVTATFCRRVVSWRGVLFGHNRTRPPPYMGWRGPCSACLTRLASFPAHPAPRPTVRAEYPHEVPVSQLLPRPRSYPRVIPVSDARRVQTPARGARFPAPPTSPKIPPGGARFRRRRGQTPARGASFPAPPTSPESPPGGARFRR